MISQGKQRDKQRGHIRGGIRDYNFDKDQYHMKTGADLRILTKP